MTQRSQGSLLPERAVRYVLGSRTRATCIWSTCERRRCASLYDHWRRAGEGRGSEPGTPIAVRVEHETSNMGHSRNQPLRGSIFRRTNLRRVVRTGGGLMPCTRAGRDRARLSSVCVRVLHVLDDRRDRDGRTTCGPQPKGPARRARREEQFAGAAIEHVSAATADRRASLEARWRQPS